MSRTILDLHVLQTVPPSNLNRDDQGSPKTAVYGGVPRARVSSQAWKKAIRTTFRDDVTEDLLGVRTKNVLVALANAIRAADGGIETDAALDLAKAVFSTLGFKLSAPRAKKGEIQQPDEAGYLVFLSNAQLKNLAGVALEVKDEDDPAAALKPRKKDLKTLAAQDASVDVALFGRMVADDTDLNVDAACQVAHALSVHTVRPEADYFTAVDDVPSRNEDEAGDAGAAMIGTIEFNSSTLYRYATIDVDRLQDNLGSAEATKIAVEAFVRGFVKSMPTGKSNTFANRTLPDLVVAQLRDTQSVSLVGAFERAIEGDHVRRATEALVARSQSIDEAFDVAPVASWVVTVGDETAAAAALGESVSLASLVSAVGSAVDERVQD